MKKYKIFISGVQKELTEERRAAKKFISNDVLLKDHFDVFIFEDYPAKGGASGVVYIDEVIGCDIYMGIFGEKYGNAGKGKMSPTEVEFREAQKNQKVVLVYIKGDAEKDNAREEGIRKLIKEVKDPDRGYCYRRFKNIDELKKLIYESLIAFLREEGVVGRVEFDRQLCKGAVLKDIDPKKVRWFLEKAKEARGFDVPVKISIKEALERLELLQNGKLLNTAILLFGKKPQRYFIQSTIRCGRIKGTTGYDFIDMKLLEGTIPELRENAIKFIVEHTRHAVYFDANQRYDKWEYPLRAVEEAITNALAHRDYLSNSDIQLAIYDNKIEIWNSGELPKSIKADDLKRKHKSIPRNKLLAKQLFLIKHIERWGMGTNRIVDEMRMSNLQDPEFQNLSGGFEITLHGPGKAFELEIEKEKIHKLSINDRQKKAIKYISKKGSINRTEYIQINNISHTIAHKELKDMITKGILKIKGAGKYIRYELTQG